MNEIERIREALLEDAQVGDIVFVRIHDLDGGGRLVAIKITIADPGTLASTVAVLNRARHTVRQAMPDAREIVVEPAVAEQHSAQDTEAIVIRATD